MYRGGKICLSDHFKPLWARNVPKFGIAHAMALGVGFPYFFSILLKSNFFLAWSMVGCGNSRFNSKRCYKLQGEDIKIIIVIFDLGKVGIGIIFFNACYF